MFRSVFLRSVAHSRLPVSVIARAAHHRPSPQPVKKEKELVAQWEIVRLGNENGFLSWCRNGYLCSVIAMTLAAQSDALRIVDELSLLALCLATYNMSMGTFGYIYNLHLQKAFVGTRRTSAMLYSSAAVGHLLLWSLIFLVYVGYEEPEEEKSHED